MYHSVYFGNKNSFSDWHLVPEGRPVIALPEMKEVKVDVPGSYGELDFSEVLTGYPVYKNRTGSLTFHVLNNDKQWRPSGPIWTNYGEWQTRYETIANYLHGKKIQIRLEDDPDWYYIGKCKVKWASPSDGTWSKLTIDYDLEPFKHNTTPITINISTNSAGSGDYHTSVTGTRVLQYDKSMPTIPTATITSITKTASQTGPTIYRPGGIFFAVRNDELGYRYPTDFAKQMITETGTYKLHGCVLSNMSGSNICYIAPYSLNGSTQRVTGTVTFDRVML